MKRHQLSDDELKPIVSEGLLKMAPDYLKDRIMTTVSAFGRNRLNVVHSMEPNVWIGRGIVFLLLVGFLYLFINAVLSPVASSTIQVKTIFSGRMLMISIAAFAGGLWVFILLNKFTGFLSK